MKIIHSASSTAGDPYGCGNLRCGHGSCYANRRAMTGTWGMMTDDPYRDRLLSEQEADVLAGRGLCALLDEGDKRQADKKNKEGGR